MLTMQIRELIPQETFNHLVGAYLHRNGLTFDPGRRAERREPVRREPIPFRKLEQHRPRIYGQG